MKSAPEDNCLKDLFQVPWSTGCLSLHPDLPQRVSKVTSYSSMGFSLCRGRWQRALSLLKERKVKLLSHVRLFATPRMVARQVVLATSPLSFS